MKKFISWMAAMAVFIFMVSCREAEEITSVPEVPQQTNNTVTGQKSDSLNVSSETSLEGTTTVVEDRDPPKKDEIEW